jgi:DNA polymerase/3'-5' exonuclease PolX
MVNEEIADIFEKMPCVLAFKGANRFRALVYERAARLLRDLDADLADLARWGNSKRSRASACPRLVAAGSKQARW